MKYFLLVLFLLITVTVSSQTDSIVPVPTQNLIEIARKMKELERVDSIKTLQIYNLQNQLTLEQQINTNTKSILLLRETEVGIYRDVVNKFVDLPLSPKTYKPKWYESNIFIFSAGVLTGSVMIWVSADMVSKLK
jgi:hypothetical protein